MTGKKKHTGRSASLPVGIAFGVLSAMVITLLGCVGLTALIAGEHLGIDGFGYGVMLVLMLSEVAGSIVSMLLVKHMKFQVSMITGVGYFLVLIAMNALFFGGQYDGVLTTGLIILAASMSTAFLGSREVKRPKRRIKFSTYR